MSLEYEGLWNRSGEQNANLDRDYQVRQSIQTIDFHKYEDTSSILQLLTSLRFLEIITPLKANTTVRKCPFNTSNVYHAYFGHSSPHPRRERPLPWLGIAS